MPSDCVKVHEGALTYINAHECVKFQNHQVHKTF